jgi:hypothetical protein
LPQRLKVAKARVENIFEFGLVFLGALASSWQKKNLRFLLLSLLLKMKKYFPQINAEKTR